MADADLRVLIEDELLAILTAPKQGDANVQALGFNTIVDLILWLVENKDLVLDAIQTIIDLIGKFSGKDDPSFAAIGDGRLAELIKWMIEHKDDLLAFFELVRQIIDLFGGLAGGSTSQAVEG